MNRKNICVPRPEDFAKVELRDFRVFENQRFTSMRVRVPHVAVCFCGGAAASYAQIGGGGAASYSGARSRGAGGGARFVVVVVYT